MLDLLAETGKLGVRTYCILMAANVHLTNDAGVFFMIQKMQRVSWEIELHHIDPFIPFRILPMQLMLLVSYIYT